MIKHIVLFKLKGFETTEEKVEKLHELKISFDELSGKIPVIRSIRAGINCNPAEAFDLALEVEVETMEDLETYAKHPAHQAVVKVLAPHKEDRSCVDYIF